MATTINTPYILEIRPRLEPENDPIAWLLIERTETVQHDRQGELLEASLSLSYRCITNRQGGRHGSFSGSFSAWNNSVSITTSSTSGSGAVFLDPPWLRGNRAGTYFLHEVIKWAKQWPGEADIRHVNVIAGQADDGNKVRRNSLYSNGGLEFIWEDPDNKVGCSKPMKVKDLVARKTWAQNIYEHDLYDHLAAQLSACEALTWEVRDCEQRITRLAKEITQANDKPMRWALAQTWTRTFPIVALLGVLAVVALTVWNGQSAG